MISDCCMRINLLCEQNTVQSCCKPARWRHWNSFRICDRRHGPVPKGPETVLPGHQQHADAQNAHSTMMASVPYGATNAKGETMTQGNPETIYRKKTHFLLEVRAVTGRAKVATRSSRSRRARIGALARAACAPRNNNANWVIFKLVTV